MQQTICPKTIYTKYSWSNGCVHIARTGIEDTKNKLIFTEIYVVIIGKWQYGYLCIQLPQLVPWDTDIDTGGKKCKQVYKSKDWTEEENSENCTEWDG